MRHERLTDRNAAERYQELTGTNARLDVVLPLALGTVFEVHQYLLRLCSNELKKHESGKAQTLQALPKWTRWPARAIPERVPDAADPPSTVDRWLEPFRRAEMLRIVEVETPDGSSGLDGSPRKASTVDGLLAVAQVVFGGRAPGDSKSHWAPVAKSILGPGRPPQLGTLAFGIAARAVFEHRTTRGHSQTNTAVGLLASVGELEALITRDAARRRWADRFRKFDGHLVERAVDGLVGSLRESGVFEHGVTLPKASSGEQ